MFFALSSKYLHVFFRGIICGYNVSEEKNDKCISDIKHRNICKGPSAPYMPE